MRGRAHPADFAAASRATAVATIAALWLACSGAVVAAELPPEARAEIEALLSQLKVSGCPFNRNGTGY